MLSSQACWYIENKQTSKQNITHISYLLLQLFYEIFLSLKDFSLFYSKQADRKMLIEIIGGL